MSSNTNEETKGGMQFEKDPSKTTDRKKLPAIKHLNALGAVLTLVQAITAAVFIYLMNGTGMIPWKYVLLTFGGLAALVLIAVFLVSIRSKGTRIAAIVVSIIVISVQLVGSNYLYRTMNLLKTSGNSYKTDTLDIVVRSNDPAETITDIAGYSFGIVDDISDEEKAALVQSLTRRTGKKVEYKEYSTASEVVKALDEGEVDVVVYREAYAPILEEVMESFSEGTRVIDTHEIRTEMAYEHVEPGEPFNILISGIDVKGDISQASRSDVNIIVTINPKTKKILMTSTPRDFYVEIPGITNGQKDKLTHAGIYGEDASIRTLEALYGIDITNYVRVNFTTLIDIVDAIDGVDVWSDYEFECYTDSEVYINKGMNHLNGRQALAFCRERFSFPDGDNQRGRDQEAVLKAIIEKVMSPALIVNASALIESMQGSFQTDIPESKIAELINQQLSEGTDWLILRQAAASGESGMKYTYSGGMASVTEPDMYSVKKNASRIMSILEERPVEEETEKEETEKEESEEKQQ